MPQLAAVGIALYFTRRNISTFLEEWDDFIEDWACQELDKWKKILWYIDPLYQDKIKALEEYNATLYKEKALY